MPEYRVLPDSPQDLFAKLRSKVQIFGGGYGNGKTAASIVQKVLPIARDYPGANILVARSTYPKLNDTIRKEFLKWIPESWIKSFPRSKNADNTCTLKNGTTINFRYIAQQGKGASEGEQTTSNLLSATYDLIVVDQLEDPEITEKDFDDLMGRLRGNARYIGNDPSMPSTGPRWFVGMLNPTRNWCYRRLVAPLHKYRKQGIMDELLLVRRYPRDHALAGSPVLGAGGKPELLIDMVEGSTYTNSHNLGADFIEGLESIYRGQTRDRMLYGEWAAYEGLVHPAFSEITHCIPQEQMREYLAQLLHTGVVPNYVEGYDYGMAVPSCYLMSFVDRYKNIFICDGFYVPEQEMLIDKQQETIARMREEWGCDPTSIVLADPAITRKTAVQRSARSKSIAQLFKEGEYPINMQGANNDVLSGLTKVNAYLELKGGHKHPLSDVPGAPNLFVASELQFVINEFTSYYWQQDSSGRRIDKPVDKNDHAMNTIKYMLSRAPELAIRKTLPKSNAHLYHWSEAPDDDTDNVRSHRHG